MRRRFLLLAAVLAPGCDSATEPSRVVAFEAATATALESRVGTDVAPAPMVRATDPAGRPLAGVPITFELHNPGSRIAHAAVTTDAAGLGTVGTWTLGSAAGVYTLTAHSRGRQVAHFMARADPGPIAQLSHAGGNEQRATIGQALAQPLRVRVADAFGNAVSGARVTFTVTSGDGRIQGDTAVSDHDGLAALAGWTLGPLPGKQQVSARSADAEIVFSAVAHDPLPSPRGQIAFVLDADIYLVEADGTGLRPLTVTPAAEDEPDWSPDGSRIAFTRGSEVHTMNADGSDVVQLTRTGGRAASPAWSPDGRYIAFASWCDGQGCIRVINADGQGPDVMRFGTERGYNGQPAWSADGARVAFISDWAAFDFAFDIFVARTDGSATTQVTRGFGFEQPAPGEQIPIKWSVQPAFSVDGRIAFLSYRAHFGTRSDPPFIEQIDLAIMNGDGTGFSIIAPAGQTSRFAPALPPALSWSPDGNHIAFSIGTCTGPTGESCTHAIAVVPADASMAPRVLVANGRGPSWRP